MAQHDAEQPDVKTPTATDYLALDDRRLLAECEVDTYRASGPGGQKRNKTSSAVRLRLPDLGLIVVGTESRSQHENRARALRRMRRAIAFEVRRPIDPAEYQPGPVLRSCLTGSGQLQVGPRDHRYDQAVGEILDVLGACGLRLSGAAALIGITTANLSSFLRRDAKLLARVNALRRQAGLKPIH